MKLKGNYDGSVTYNVGDIVIGEDDIVYHLQKPCAAGTNPKDTRYWSRTDGVTAEIVLLIRDAVANVEAKIPNNIDDEAISLKSGDDEYLITVDASGETPDLVVSLIEEEGD